MSKKFIGILFSFVVSQVFSQRSTLISHVQIFSGTSPSTTKSALKHSSGTENLANTIPAVTLPFSMIQWTPQTRPGEQKCNAPYYYNDPYFSGIRGTHWISGSCMPDYGSFTIMPTTGKLVTTVNEYRTKHNPRDEYATPAYYSINLSQYQVKAEVVPTQRCSMMRFTVDTNDAFNLLISPNSDKGEGFIKIDKLKNEVSGFNPALRIYQGWGKPAGFSGYFVIQVEKVPGQAGIFEEAEMKSGDSVYKGKNIGAYMQFAASKEQQYKIKIGTSFTSIQDARKNVEAEMLGWDFEDYKQKAEAEWERSLGQVRVKTSNEKHKQTFYTAMYHSMLHPRLFTNADGTYPMFDHQYENAKVKEGTHYYDDFSMWDLFRAQLPLWQILRPAMINDFVRSMILKGQQGDWLPIFPCWNSFTSAMIGDHVTAFIASAYSKGIRNYDVKEAYRLMRQNAFTVPNEADYKDGKGRRALPSYLQYNYIPLEDNVMEAFHKREQVSRTLEYAFDDYCLSVIAKDIGEKKDYEALVKRSQNYKNVYDNKVGFMNGRYENGSWYKSFDPDVKASFITEGTPRQYSFFVPHDIEGLVTLMGGKSMFEKALDSIFAKEQYWHGNEPSHAIPFLYNYTNAPWKTSLVVKKIIDEEYDTGTGGLSGNDDSGQMSAWYVFAAMGFYPVNPASDKYMLSTPLFDEVSIALPNKKVFRLVTKKASASSLYIQSLKLNGVPYKQPFLLHKDLVKGGTLEFVLTDRHN